MPYKIRFWKNFSSFKDAEKAWDKGASEKSTSHPLKILKHTPEMVGIEKETAKFLKWKSLKYLITHDKRKAFPRFIFKHPLKYTLGFLRSCLKKKPYSREGDFFYYGLKNLEEFKNLLEDKNALFVIGFSYCHKPFECPSGRFSSNCIHDPDNPVCRQCFIGKAINTLPEEGVIALCIPTIHYIGEKILKVREQYPKRKIFFLITACEMTLEMFGDWGNMTGIKGLGVRLSGRICNTMKAFELSEEGIKPGLTVIANPTQEKIMSFLNLLSSLRSDTTS